MENRESVPVNESPFESLRKIGLATTVSDKRYVITVGEKYYTGRLNGG